jgi:phage tail sheath gpL-like
MGLTVNSIANAVGSSVKNLQFTPEARNVDRKILIIGSQLAAKSFATETPTQVLSAEDVADKTGFGGMLHRLAVRTFEGGNGIETWMVVQDENGAAAGATGDIDWAGTAGVLAGTIYLYIAGISVPVAIAAGTTLEAVSDAVVAAVNADTSLPVTAAKRAVTFETDFTSKSLGTWGNFISIAFNLGAGEALPTGVAAAITAMSGGATNPTMQDALDSLGTNDDANEEFFTDVVHGYGMDDSTAVAAVKNYVGIGNDFTALYDKLVGRPFRCLMGDTVAGAAGLAAAQVIAAVDLTDRANGIISVPDSPNHPDEIAALALGLMAKVNQDRAAQSYNGLLLPGIWPGDKGTDRWTSDYDNRDTAVKSGVSPTKVNNGSVYMQNVVTFYRPASVPVASNGYRSMRNISILQNILYNVRVNFEQEKWQGISIVADTANVGNVIDRAKARDVDAVIDDLVALAKSFEDRAWLYESAFTIAELKKTGAVTIRSGSSGFDSLFNVILSGEGGILDTVTQFDTSIAVLTA